jgi:hypothetical protein
MSECNDDNKQAQNEDYFKDNFIMFSTFLK